MTTQTYDIRRQENCLQQLAYNKRKLKYPEQLFKIRSRINNIIDEQLVKVCEIYKKQKRSEQKDKFNLQINQSKLQEWIEIFTKEVLVIQSYNQSFSMIKHVNERINQQNYSKENQEYKLTPPIPAIDKQQNNKYLFQINNNTLKLIQLSQEDNHVKHSDQSSLNQNFNKFIFQLPQHIIKPNSTSTLIQKSSQIIFIGGCKLSNPNIKSTKIYSFNIIKQKLKLIARLPIGLSSHSAIFCPLNHSIYIVGGNKNNSIITRGCYQLKLDSSSSVIEQISCLNSPAASMNCILWREQWIYKFGGVGDALGQLNVSPYIQRYSVRDNYWQVINPRISSRLTQVERLSLNSISSIKPCSYICQKTNQIFVFGGYSINQDKLNQGFIISVQQKAQLDNQQYIDQSIVEYNKQQNHSIISFGQISKQFYYQTIGLSNNSFIYVQLTQKQIAMITFQNTSIYDNSQFNIKLIHTFIKQ